MTEEQDIKDIQKEQRNYLTWQQFIWFVGVLIIALGYMNVRISFLENRVNDGMVSFAKIETQLTQIQKDIVGLNVLLEKHLDSNLTK